MKRRIGFLFAGVLGLFLGLLLGTPLLRAADDFERYKPKEVPAQPGAAEASPTPQDTLPGSPEAVLIGKVKAFVFVGSPQAVGPVDGAWKGVIISTEVPDPGALRALVTPLVGQPMTRGGLNALVREIVLYFRAHDRPIVDVIIPEQEVTTGTLQVILLEGKVGKVTATGARWASNEAIRTQIPFRTGAVIRSDEVQGSLDRLNGTPFRATTLIYSAGKTPGTTDVELRTKDRFPLRTFAGYEDSGNTATGRDRYLAGFNWGDAFGQLGQQLNYQYMMSGDDTSLRAHAASWTAPIPWADGHTATVYGSHVTTSGEIPGGLFHVAGTSYQLSGRYNAPLPSVEKTVLGAPLSYTESAGGGFDYKYNNNSLAFGGIPYQTGMTEVYQFAFTYSGKLVDPYGATTLDAQAYWSPGSLGGGNNDTAFDASHQGATSHYLYSSVNLSRQTALPGDWSLLTKGTVQASDANLTSSEQLALGGYATVRGYEEQEVIADEGYVVTTELHTPPISLSPHVASLAGTDAGPFQDQLIFLGFWDYGNVWNHTLTAADLTKTTTLSSVGLGLRYTLGTYASVRFDYGWQLHSTGLDQDRGSRGSLGVVLSY